MQQSSRTQGFFTFAQNTDSVDYIRLAYGLALSLKHSQKTVKNLSIGITPGTIVDQKYAWAFDSIIEIPWGDMAENSEWKLENEWKVPFISPYDDTIKLDCDMLFLSDITQWWDKLISGEPDIVWANVIRNYRGESPTNDYYRKVFTANNLPNVYSGCMYFRKTAAVFEFYYLIKLITIDWESFFTEFLEPQTRPSYFSTDVAVALAAKILDLDQLSYKDITVPTFTHMKTRLQNWAVESINENWQEYVTPVMLLDGTLKIDNYTQRYPFHYHIKEFLTNDIIAQYERLLQL